MGQLLDPDCIVQVSPALAAVGLRKLQPKEAELGAAPVALVGELPRGLPLIDVGRDLGGDEAGNGCAQLLVLLAKGRERGAAAAVLDDSHPVWRFCGPMGDESAMPACDLTGLQSVAPPDH